MDPKQDRITILILITSFISTTIVAADFIRSLFGFQISPDDFGIFLRENRKILMLLFAGTHIPYHIWMIISIYQKKYNRYIVALGVFMTMLYVLLHFMWQPVETIDFPEVPIDDPGFKL